MGTPYSAILTLIITAGVINVLMGIYALSGRSKVSMVKTFVAFSLMSAIYTFGSALELAAGSSRRSSSGSRSSTWACRSCRRSTCC